jgi:hypothetical protein
MNYTIHPYLKIVKSKKEACAAVCTDCPAMFRQDVVYDFGQLKTIHKKRTGHKVVYVGYKN